MASTNVSGTDVGILNGEEGAQANNSNNSNNDQEIIIDTSSRYDVYKALKKAKFVGSPCIAGKADGTMPIPALPFTPGISVDGVGKISLPIIDTQQKLLKCNSFNTNDASFKNVYQIEPNDIKINNPAWDTSFNKLLKVVCSKIGVRSSDIASKLDMLIYLERGSSIDWCSNVEEDEQVIGSLLIQLPSVFTGGKISIFSGGSEEDEEDETFTNQFDLSSEEAEYSCHFVFHYSDCQYKMEKLKSGTRMLLRYALSYHKQGTKPTAQILNDGMIPVSSALSNLPRMDRLFLVPLAKEYSTTSLAKYGFNCLASSHRAKAEAIKASGENWKVFTINVQKLLSSSSEYGGGGVFTSSENKIISIYDEKGNSVKTSTKWLHSLLNFFPVKDPAAAVEEAPTNNDDNSYDMYDDDYSNPRTDHVEKRDEDDNFGDDDGMLLSTSKIIEDNFGKRKSRKTETTHHGRYSYGSDASYENISTYRATFLLAYDTSSEVELKCLAGSDGVTAIAETVANSRDYSLLERLVTAISSKEKTLFSVETCQKLLLMILQSKKDELSTRRIALMNQTLVGLTSSQDPDVPLWDSILSSVKRFGWKSLSQSVTSLLNRKSKGKARQIGCTSKITLKVCLNRVVFLLNLGQLDEELDEDRSSFVQNRIAECMTDLNSDTGDKDVYEKDIKESTTKIMSLVTSFGWEQMSNVLKHSLPFISSKAKSISSTLAEGELVMRLHKVNNCNIIQGALRKFAGKFASVLQSNSYGIENGFKGEEHTSILECIELLLKYGTQKDHDVAGNALVARSKIFSAMLKALSEFPKTEVVNSQALLRDILNKCLVQQHTPAQGGWENELVSNNKGLIIVPPSPMHICKVLKACPNLVSVADEQDRLTLHYAAGSSTASYETIECIFQADQKSASVRDPISGLYPFMAAGSNDNISASFELLRANPNLVAGGTQASVDDEENEKKRKRSSSME